MQPALAHAGAGAEDRRLSRSSPRGISCAVRSGEALVVNLLRARHPRTTCSSQRYTCDIWRSNMLQSPGAEMLKMCPFRHPATHNRRRYVKARAKSSMGVADSRRVQSRSREAKRGSQKLLARHPQNVPSDREAPNRCPFWRPRHHECHNTFAAFHMASSPNAKKKKQSSVSGSQTRGSPSCLFLVFFCFLQFRSYQKKRAAC